MVPMIEVNGSFGIDTGIGRSGEVLQRVLICWTLSARVVAGGTNLWAVD
jgi:hypothetical protein